MTGVALASRATFSNTSTSPEAARYLGVTPRTLYRFINDGRVAAYKIGRVIRLQRADLDGFIEANRIAPGSLEHLTPELRSVSD